VPSSLKLKPSQAIAITASITSACFYMAYRGHDRRVLSEHEVTCARGALARITPSAQSSSAYSSATPMSSTTEVKESRTAQHLFNLNEYGATVVKDTLTAPQLIEWKRRASDAFHDEHNVVRNSGRAHYCISRHSEHYSDMTRVGCGRDDDGDGSEGDANSSRRKTKYPWLRIFRRSDNINNTNADTTSSSKPLTLQDIVKSYFQQHGIERYELTDLQFLNALPKSTNQIWHRDNKFRGLTAIVALQNVRGNGPTELILKSHQPKYTLWPRIRNAIAPSFFSSNGELEHEKSSDSIVCDQPLLGCIDAGDTIIYDARIFHRGRGNNITNTDGVKDSDDNENDRPVLVLRWDAARTPPPGAGIIVTTSNIYVGSMLYAALFALQKLAPLSDNGNK